MLYRKRVLETEIETEKTPDYEIKQMNILDALATAASAWDDVSQKTIANCFRHAGFKLLNKQRTNRASSYLNKAYDEIKKMMSKL
ncbi:hypothetical protein RRG08_042488 [Elysia crispata]|uniref:DDE-1 domain-containing protein n=1 Tax=Elysia crispata TaxID=231223 RepID=A0AAE0YDA2_9GAST|nr:hypothetical protein RRG08_042488 [Elysia crispata]